MGKKAKEIMSSSTYECMDCGAIIKTFNTPGKNKHVDVPCPERRAFHQGDATYDTPDYCKFKKAK